MQALYSIIIPTSFRHIIRRTLNFEIRHHARSAGIITGLLRSFEHVYSRIKRAYAALMT